MVDGGFDGVGCRKAEIEVWRSGGRGADFLEGFEEFMGFAAAAAVAPLPFGGTYCIQVQYACGSV
jgi:hypothetical protein